METIYKINKVIVIINLILALTIYFGMLFLPITGIVQIASFVYFLCHWKNINPRLKNHFIGYGISVVITLSILSCINFFKSSSFFIWMPMISGICLAIYFLLLSKWQMEYTYTHHKPQKFNTTSS